MESTVYRAASLKSQPKIMNFSPIESRLLLLLGGKAQVPTVAKQTYN